MVVNRKVSLYIARNISINTQAQQKECAMNNKPNRVVINLTPDQRAAILAKAEVKGLNVTAYIRMIALDATETAKPATD